MLNVLLEKCADWLLPIIGGCLVWYGVHYFILTPRIVAIDSQKDYAYDSSLSSNVNACLQKRLGDQVLKHGLMEAALYTATMKHMAEPYQAALLLAHQALDVTCGVSYARRMAVERQRKAAREAAERQRLEQQFKFWKKLLTGK
jgi:hypothetical protein